MTAAAPSSPRCRRADARVPLALRMADETGLTYGPKSLHINAKVQPALFDAAAERLGTRSPAAVVEAALATLAAQDGLGPWLLARS